MRPWVGRTGVPRSSAGSEGVKKYRKWVAMVRKIRTLQHVANPISEFLHTLSAGAIGILGGGSEGGRSPPPSAIRWAGALTAPDRRRSRRARARARRRGGRGWRRRGGPPRPRPRRAGAPRRR